MIQIDKKENCCGCTACESVCPRNCISMISDAEGFKYPTVKKENCIGCRVCEKVCPVISKDSHNLSTQICETYVGYFENEEVRMASSSGGIFSAIAQGVISRNGAVFGAAFDKNFEVRHIEVEDVQGLGWLRGSKYIQSNLSGVYEDVHKELKKNRPVLFTGAPCQIAGLKGYLREDYSNLITVDILCHGVPSPKVWKRYLYELELENGKIKSINFRLKKPGWYDYSTRIEFCSGKVIEQSHFDNTFMKLFLGDICIRPSCHKCRFKNINRISDITIGDCWGIDRIDQDFQDDRGVSVIILHSEKGKTIFSDIKNQLYYKAYDLEKVLPSNSQSRVSVEAHINRSKLFKCVSQNCSMAEMQKTLQLSLFDKLRRKLRTKLKSSID